MREGENGRWVMSDEIIPWREVPSEPSGAAGWGIISRVEMEKCRDE